MNNGVALHRIDVGEIRLDMSVDDWPWDTVDTGKISRGAGDSDREGTRTGWAGLAMNLGPLRWVTRRHYSVLLQGHLTMPRIRNGYPAPCNGRKRDNLECT